MSHDIDDILERVLCGDLSKDSAEFRSACSTIPDLPLRLARLEEVCATLDAAAVEERAGLERELADTRFESAERAYADSLRAQMSVRRGGHRARNFAIAAAAAAIVTVSYFAMERLAGNGSDGPGSRREERDAEKLSLRTASGISPNESTRQSEFSVFDWSGVEHSDGSTFVLRVFRDDSFIESSLLYESEPTESTSLTVDPRQTSDWPDQIYLKLQVTDVSGRPVYVSERATRSKD